MFYLLPEKTKGWTYFQHPKQPLFENFAPQAVLEAYRIGDPN